MAHAPVDGITSDGRKSAKQRLQAIIERQLNQIHEAEARQDRRSERERVEDQYREVIEEAITRQDRALEVDHHDEVIGQRVADAAEARVLYAGKNALKHSPHRGEKISPAEIEAIDRSDHPLLLTNHAALTAMAAERHAIREAIPAEDKIGPEAYQSLVRLTRPRSMDTSGSSYANYSSMPDTMRRELRMGLVQDMMQRIDEELATERVAELEAQGVTDQEQLDRAGLTYHWVARDVMRKRGRGEEISQDDVEMVSTMREAIRQRAREVIPEWKPENPAPWLGAAEQVFDISLAAVPRQPGESTLYEGTQNLLAGDQVFALRAQDQTGEAIGRQSSAMRQTQPASGQATTDKEWLA